VKGRLSFPKVAEARDSSVMPTWPITKHDEPSLADNAASNTTTPPIIDKTKKSLQRARLSIANLMLPGITDINSSPYILTVLNCVYDLYKDHRGTVSAKAWITS
jgi:hypothetical protein